MELWGLGDLTFATPVLREATTQNEVHLVAKPYARELLHPSLPGVKFIRYDAPWTRYLGKYKLWEWDWRKLFSLIFQLRKEKYDAAVSVRNDPRDHLFMWLIGARERYGFPLRGSGFFLTHPLARSRSKQHKVEDWIEIGKALALPGIEEEQPRLRHPGYLSQNIEEVFAGIRKPVVCVHVGARIPVRRWPEAYFENIIRQLRRHFDFHLILVPDPDGYGLGLAPLADVCISRLSVRELIDLVGRADLLFCNDSGPSHIAASCGRPVIPIFGPSDPGWFRPWGDIHKVVIRDICPWRPCKDYCLFSEAYCMTKLMPDSVWPEIHRHILWLIERGIIPRTMMRDAPMPATGIRA